MKRRFIFILLGMIWALGLAQCGSKEDLSSKVKAEWAPKSPVVVNADLTLNPGTADELKIIAPWFLFGAGVENGSDKKLYLVTFTFDVTGRKNSVPVKSHSSIEPSTACDTRVFLAVIPAGSTYIRVTDACDATTVASDGSFDHAFIDKLPDADSFNYAVDITAEGWFVDDKETPIERLILTGSIMTQ